MPTDTLIRITALCVVLASAETLHGIARMVWVVPRIGKDKAVRLSVLTGSLLALLICALLVPQIGLQGAGQHLALGLLLAAFMAAFDVAVGMLLMRRPWRKVAPDFDPHTGNLLSFGLAFLALAPWLVWVTIGSRAGS
jgi:hypothetical protein